MNASIKTQVKKAAKVVAPEMEDLEIIRDGKKLILPADVDYDEIIKAVKQQKESEEQVVGFHQMLDGYPLDGIVAVGRAMEDVYGYTHAQTTGFWGAQPPTKLSIKTGPGDEDVTYAVYGELYPVTWEGGYLNLHVSSANPLALTIQGYFKRKFEAEVKNLIKVAKKFLVENSIYRGKPCEIDLSYVNGDDFDPDMHTPKFMDVSQEIDLILPRDIERQLKGCLWDVMRNPKAYAKNGVQFKRALLLSGKFGTGKTLTSRFTAQVAAANGLTFFYLKNPDQFVKAYELSALYGPSVLFIEDIDSVFGGDRDRKMNEILNCLDGIGTKTNQVACVFTTNYPERVNAAFNRPGRIDLEIEYTAPDADAAARLLQKMGGKLLAQDAIEHLKELGELFAGLVPAQIAGALGRAKEFSIGDHGENITGKVSLDALEVAGRAAQKASAKAMEKPESEDAKALRGLREGLTFLGVRR